ncbi:MAG: NUDIX hydrolase [Cyclobacteriaceae bacterium]|nr:NUDIX hydrolase [Cyclobacteriaceae bacterium]
MNFEMSKGNKWQTISQQKIYENPWIRLEEHQVINPAGGEGIYGKVVFKNKAVGIVPLDKDNCIWLVGQHRYTLNTWSWEIPEGGSPLDVDPLESAKRELKEETGLTAHSWTEIARVYLSNSVSDEEGFLFLAEDLEIGLTHLEDSEADLQVKKLSFEEALKMVENGEITDSLSVIGILKVARIKGF